MFYLILTISYLRAQTIETSSLPTDSSWPLFKQIEIFSILTVWQYISTVRNFLNIRAGSRDRGIAGSESGLWWAVREPGSISCLFCPCFVFVSCCRYTGWPQWLYFERCAVHLYRTLYIGVRLIWWWDSIPHRIWRLVDPRVCHLIVEWDQSVLKPFIHPTKWLPFTQWQKKKKKKRHLEEYFLKLSMPILWSLRGLCLKMSNYLKISLQCLSKPSQQPIGFSIVTV